MMTSTTVSGTCEPALFEPSVKIHYIAPGFCLPQPDTIDKLCEDDNNLVFCHGRTIVKTSPNVVVKFRPDVKPIEATTMIHIAEKTGVPVPKVFACYTYGPMDRDIDHFGSYYDTYIFMSFVPGETLHTAWDKFDVATKARIARELTGYIQEIREMASEGYIGSVNHGPVLDHGLSTSCDKGEAFPHSLMTTAFEFTNISPRKARLIPRKTSILLSSTTISNIHRENISKASSEECSPQPTA